ncbi:LuxR C-terminal-related transcriptional regulator [Microbacterium sediminicola]|uniref:LuxR C-terminal-related transcriptional regulator n=1 Tax=Microbacterium sediminicola TaxID=415210 RepID=A0ABN2HWQ0_9MICO
MLTALARGRALSDLDVVSRAGLTVTQFMDEATEALQRAVPFVAACSSTLDPATAMVSSTRKYAGLAGNNGDDIRWAQIEYGEDDPTSIAQMVVDGKVAVGVHHEFDGNLDASIRMAEFLQPRFDYVDEARVVFTDRSGAWGAISLFRTSEDGPFTRDELELLAKMAPSFSRGIRTGLLAQVNRIDGVTDSGPAVVIVDAHDRLAQVSPGAASQLARIASVPNAGDPFSVVQALVSGARRFARGEISTTPRVRLRTEDGVWLVVHAAPLGGRDERAGDVVVTIEEARPQEVIDIVAAAFGLTSREREVVALVLRGSDTKDIAATMHVSPYTVQDHLKSVFEKAGVTSRRELVSRVYFDQYVPRWGGELGATGWFVGAERSLGG